MQPEQQNNYHVGYYEEQPLVERHSRRKKPRKTLRSQSIGKSRTISPANMPVGNSNLRQPLAFHQQTGSLGPPKNRQRTYEEPSHNVNSTAIFPQQYENQLLSSIENDGSLELEYDQEDYGSPQRQALNFQNEPRSPQQYHNEYNDTDEINRSYEKIRQDHRNSRSSHGFGSSQGKQQMHSREISFQQLTGFNKGVQILTSQRQYQPPNAPREQFEDENSRNQNVTTENDRSLQRSSNRSKSMEMMVQNDRMVEQEQMPTHYRQNTQEQQLILNFRSQEELSSPQNRDLRVKSNSPRNYREQPVSSKRIYREEPVSSKRNYETKSEQVIASPRFSQNTDENVGSSQLKNKDIQMMSRKRSRNYMQIENQESEENDYGNNQEHFAKTSNAITSGREGLNMNFNTQDLMQMTCPDLNNNGLYGTREREQSNAFRSLQPSGMGVEIVDNANRSTSINNQAQSMNMTTDARAQEQMFQTQQQQKHDTFRDESFANINMQKQFETQHQNNFVSQAQNNQLFSPEGAHMGNMTLSELNQTNGHMGSHSNQFQNTTILHNIPNQMGGTFDSMDMKFSHKLNNQRFHSFVEKVWLKKRLIQIHQNLSQKRYNYKDFNQFELLDEIELMTQNTNVSHQGLSKLSDIDSHFQISRADMSYQNAINPNKHMRTLNPQISSSTLVEMDDLKRQREDSEAIINNLRKTIKDMAKQMKQMEIRLEGSNYNSLQSLSPRDRNVTNNRDKQLSQMGSQYLQYELEQKVQEIDDCKTEHQNYTSQLKEKFRIKFNEQNQFIDDLKAELAKQSNNSEVIRLENQVQMLQRQIQMQRNQQMCDNKTHESDLQRLQSSKEQEKHWKCGYETIFQKYTALKEQMNKKDEEVRRMEWENDSKIKALTRKAEEAINYFKNLAVRDDTRVGRFEQESRTTLHDDYQLRSRSSNIEDMRLKSYHSQTLTRAGHVNPAQEYLGGTSKSFYTTQKPMYGRSHSNHVSNRKSYSPQRSEKNGSIPAIRFRGNEVRGSSTDNQLFSPKAHQKLTLIEKIQQNLGEEKPGSDTKLFLALEALEKSFQEINQYKKETNEVSMKYFSRNCEHLQDFQVLSYDYMEQIESHLQRESLLQAELAKKDAQITSLRDIVSQSKLIINSLKSQIKEQRQIKEMQFQNIISYDTLKDQEKKIQTETINQEVHRAKLVIQDLHCQIQGREQIIEGKNREAEGLEMEKNALQNQLSLLRDQHEDTCQHLQIVGESKEELEKRHEQISEQIKSILFGTCGVIEHEYQQSSERQTLSEQKMTFNRNSEHILDERQLTPQVQTTQFSGDAGEIIVSQESPRQVVETLPFEQLNHINYCINELQNRIHMDNQYIASLGSMIETDFNVNQSQDTSDFKPTQGLAQGETLSQSLDSFINRQRNGVNRNSGSMDLKGFVQTNYSQANGSQHKVDASAIENDNSDVCFSDAPLVDRNGLNHKLSQLIISNQLKNETIASLQSEIEKVNEEYNTLDIESSTQITENNQTIKKLTDEKEQLNQVYQQENQMRQELEGLCDEKTMAIDEAKKQISQCEMDLEHLQEQHDNVVTEKERLLQSNEYWQNSFKLIETHFMEQKAKAETEMDNLSEQISQYETDLLQKNSKISRLQDHVQLLEAEWLPVKRARENTRVAQSQTDVKFTQIESLIRLEDENRQIKQDIQHLIEQYEKMKEETSKNQQRMQDKITTLESQKKSQQTLIENQMKLQQNIESEQYNYLQQQLKNMEKDKEEAELQLISQKDQIDQLTQFNQVMQNYTNQLQQQLETSHSMQQQTNQISSKCINDDQSARQYMTVDAQPKERDSQFSFVEGRNQKPLNSVSGSQTNVNSIRGPRTHHGHTLSSQSNNMDADAYNNDPHNESMGLDMCQSCIEHEETIQKQNEQIRKLITTQVQNTRKLTSMCLEGSILLKTDSIRVKEHNLNSKKRNQSYDFEKVNLSVISEPEQKTQSIKSAQKFLQKNLEYFMAGSATKKLLKYSDKMIDIAQHIVQNSCEIQMKYRQSNLQKSQSLKIDDYHSDLYSEKGCQVNDGTQTTGREERVNTYTGEPAVLSGQRGMMSFDKRQPMIPKYIPDHVVQKLDYLGVSLDNKITAFVKLLSQLKKLSNDDKIKKYITSTISKAIHELTIDTESLNDIKTELEQQQVTSSSLSHQLPLNQDQHRETAGFQNSSSTGIIKSSSASETRQMPTHAQNILRMNFVNEDGRTVSDTFRSGPRKQPMMFKNYNYHITNSSKTIALSKGNIDSSPFLHTENVSNRAYNDPPTSQYKYVSAVDEETETDSELKQNRMNETRGVETLVQDMSHIFKERCNLSPRAYLNQSLGHHSNQELEKCRDYMKTINEQQNYINNMSSFQASGPMMNTLDTSNISRGQPAVSKFAKKQFKQLNQTITQPPRHQHHISLRDPNVVSSQNFNNDSLLSSKENFKSLEAKRFNKAQSIDRFNKTYANYSDYQQ